VFNWEWNHALCLCGGSLYGLEAVAGVVAELWSRRSYTTEWTQFVLASGAAVYDFGEGRTQVYPDKALGRAAVRALQPGRFPLGPRGAGRSTSCGWPSEPAGQGGAFRQVGATRLAVFSVVNSNGCVIDRAGRVVRGNLDAATGLRQPSLARLEARLAAGGRAAPHPGNTTLTVVVTNQALDRQNLTQFGRQVHSSMSRAIQPFHALHDGDVLYAVTTAAVEDSDLSTEDLGLLAGELAWDAVLSAVTAGRP
jgi:L-aminopeptidase/D-esterase-like protein